MTYSFGPHKPHLKKTSTDKTTNPDNNKSFFKRLKLRFKHPMSIIAWVGAGTYSP